MFLYEKELEDMLCDWLDCKIWLPLKCRDDIFQYERQVNLGEYGIPDIVLYRLENDRGEVLRTIEIVELKLNYLRVSDVAQICKYKAYFDSIDHGFDRIDYTIICKENDSDKSNNNLKFLVKQLGRWLSIDCYMKDKFNRIKFEEPIL